MDLTQFKSLLFANPTLVRLLVDWLYRQVVHSGSDNFPAFGEYYLYNKHDNDGFIGWFDAPQKARLSPSFDDIQFQCMDQNLVDDRFSSMVDFIKGENPSANTLQDYCGKLYTFSKSYSTKGVDWLINGGASGLETALAVDFTGDSEDVGQYESKYKDGYVTGLVDGLIGGFPLLRYFRDYLIDHLKHDYSSGAWGGNLVLSGYEDSIKDSIDAVGGYITENVQTALVLGGYRGGVYPGIDAYLQQNLITLLRPDVGVIMSANNAKQEMVASVKSSPFFGEYATYDDLREHKDDDNLFQVGYNAEFAALSKYLDTNRAIDIDWTDAKNELFVQWANDADVLKNFIRSQFYRPMFFNPNDFKTFTTNSDAYYCITDKFYTNHDGDQHQLVFDPDDWGNVDKNASGLGDKPGVYTILEGTINYFKNTNTFEYQMQYEPIQIQNGKFVYGDVEYYVVYSEDIPHRVTSVYYNQFNDVLFHADGEVQVDDNNEFTLNGSTYKIQDGMVLWISDEITFDTKYICDIRNNMFVLDGLWCILSADETKIEYAKVDDNDLEVRYIAQNNETEWTNFGLKFKFASNGNSVSVIRRVQSEIVDKVDIEWCEYDDIQIDFD